MYRLYRRGCSDKTIPYDGSLIKDLRVWIITIIIHHLTLLPNKKWEFLLCLQQISQIMNNPFISILYRLISSRNILLKVAREHMEEEEFPTGSLKHRAFSLDTKQVLLSFFNSLSLRETSPIIFSPFFQPNSNIAQYMNSNSNYQILPVIVFIGQLPLSQYI